MISLSCPECGEPFQRSTKRAPKVLPCGHSQCADCLFQACQSRGYYSCRQCVQKFDPALLSFSPPTNTLYFDMLDKLEQFIRQKEWEQDQSAHAALLRIEEQCLYTFCQRRKFERDGIIELYCSQQCKRNHEELEEMM